MVGGICNVRLHTSIFISASLIACTSLNKNELESQQVLDRDCPDVFLLVIG